ncbi:ferritin-like domain-containing protein [Clostridium tyrobutyricum]|uniref:ferritin-like domain-containing protein n=1 Tax=Clostridium tyrobutyricum TaxID=1519 RepID=UPI002013559A|nr:ferritin-like domain-containing protein [Clostridium tyrobutyricum]MBR9647209.1 ferritin-like domain-containing protein [Clostridium tyrobutyricum]
MSYTVKNGQPQGYPYFFTNKIREALIGEIIAINGYVENINTAWRSILKDEKNHYVMLLNLLRKYDPVQYQKYNIQKSESSGIKTVMQSYKPNYDSQIILNNVRADIKGEFEAVILYEQLFAEFRQQDIKHVIYLISSDEKEHAEHLTRILFKYYSNTN